MIYLGSTDASKVYLGSTEVSKVYVGTEQVWPVAGFTEMGMDKSGTFVATKNSTTKVTGWVVRSGYPDTVITNNALVVNGDGNITAYCYVTRTGTSYQDKVAIYKNGVQVAISNQTTFDTYRSVNWTGNVVDGDTLDVRYQNGSYTSDNNITGGYLYYAIN